MHSSLAAKPSSSHECLAVLGWRRWEEGRGAGEGEEVGGREKGRRRGRCIGGVGGGEKRRESEREGRDRMFNNSHNRF